MVKAKIKPIVHYIREEGLFSIFFVAAPRL